MVSRFNFEFPLKTVIPIPKLNNNKKSKKNGKVPIFVHTKSFDHIA
jgi:hypothetical protein